MWLKGGKKGLAVVKLFDVFIFRTQADKQKGCYCHLGDLTGANK